MPVAEDAPSRPGLGNPARHCGPRPGRSRHRWVNGQRAQRRYALAATAMLLLTLVGCGSSSEGASTTPPTTTAAVEPTATTATVTETTEKVFSACSDAVILGNVFDEEMVAECVQISGVASTACPDGSMVGLIEVSGSLLVVHAGGSAQQVDDTVAEKLNDQRPFRYDVDEAKLLDRCG